jgi:putative restriction endonuclease
MGNQTQIFIAPVSNEHAQEHLRRTVIKGVPADLYQDYTGDDYGDPASIWGISRGGADKYGDKMQPGDILLFYTGDREYTYMAEIAATEENSDLSKATWNAYSGTLRRDDSDNPWPFILYLTNGKSMHLSSTELHGDAGWGRDYPMAFSRFSPDDVEEMVSPYGSVRAYLRAKRTDEPQPPTDEVQEAKKELEEQLDDNPQLTEDETEYTEVKRRKRSSAFQSTVQKQYNNTCAVCGSQRETPAGTPEVEAAHIYPKSESGSDDPRNGLTLCRLHHWAFDNGWLAVSDEYEVLVKDQPTRTGYEEFVELEGQTLKNPEDEKYRPHQKFLAAHREFHGFE